jgi:predicted Abi (CAAX) family protease
MAFGLILEVPQLRALPACRRQVRIELRVKRAADGVGARVGSPSATSTVGQLEQATAIAHVALSQGAAGHEDLEDQGVPLSYHSKTADVVSRLDQTQRFHRTALDRGLYVDL